MRVAITGASGFVGSAVRERLLDAGHEVKGLKRGDRADSSSDWNPAQSWVREGVLEGIDAVMMFGGVSIGSARWTEERKRLLRSSRIDSTRVMVDHIETLSPRPRVFITASGIGYYGYDRGDEVLREDASRGHGFLADLVSDWEAAAERASALGMRTVMTRFAPSVARHGELLRKMLPPFLMGVGGPIGGGRQWFSWVALPDLADAVRFCLEQDSVEGPVNVSSPVPVPNADFTRALGRALHRPALLPLPAFAARLAFGEGRADEMLLASQRAVPARLAAAGFEFRYPDVEAALRAALADDATNLETRRAA
jgi:uncharacterized protein (TIGR01777 family)